MITTGSLRSGRGRNVGDMLLPCQRDRGSSACKIMTVLVLTQGVANTADRVQEFRRKRPIDLPSEIADVDVDNVA